MKNAPTSKPKQFNKEAQLKAINKNLTIKIAKGKAIKEELAVQPETTVKIVPTGDNGIISSAIICTRIKEKADKVLKVDITISRSRDKCDNKFSHKHAMKEVRDMIREEVRITIRCIKSRQIPNNRLKNKP